MTDNVYSVTEIVGSSRESVGDAIQNAISTASKTLRDLEWFEVSEIRGHIEEDKVGHFQVSMKIGFKYDR